MRTIPREAEVNLSERQKALIIGTLLGDGNLSKHGKYHRLYVKHCYRQKVLTEWKWQELKSIVTMPIQCFSQMVRGKSYNFCHFVTRTEPELSGIAQIFYKNARKTVPDNIQEILVNPFSLAVWIMDDGTRSKDGMSLQTYSFTFEEVKMLVDALKANFGLCTTIQEHKLKPVLYILKKEVHRLFLVVKDYILPEFHYKFPLAP